ncbi:hypothetical protein [Paludisphaera soli]|uniref:hypothetical protein n=1 Tax=Paludisphaera soli TaxID=2712865 RepID=UPI0013EAC330|nr:hypothetical protein [Paludisphaera soli]
MRPVYRELGLPRLDPEVGAPKPRAVAERPTSLEAASLLVLGPRERRVLGIEGGAGACSRGKRERIVR